MKKEFDIRCLDNDKTYIYFEESAMDAMRKLKYMLNLWKNDDKCTINTSKLGRHLWMEHCGKTYAVAY